MPEPGLGRWTLGLYNSYDPNHFHESMRRAVARAAPLCLSFGMNLAPIGFPFHAYRDRSGSGPERETPLVLAGLMAESTSIGEGGKYLQSLARAGRFLPTPFPEAGFPPQLGVPVLATRSPDPGKSIGIRGLVRRTLDGESFLFLVGLGPRGVPKPVHRLVPWHLELSGAGHSLETATAFGVLAGRLAEALDHARRPAQPRLTVDALVEVDGRVLLVRRAREPFKGAWALPGGFVEPDETPERAVLRELREETDVDGIVEDFAGVYSRPGRDPRGPTISLAYRVRVERIEPVGGDDATEARLWPLDALPSLAFDHEEILNEAFQRPRARKPES